jgi:hypothetical protein
MYSEVVGYKNENEDFFAQGRWRRGEKRDFSVE